MKAVTVFLLLGLVGCGSSSQFAYNAKGEWVPVSEVDEVSQPSTTAEQSVLSNSVPTVPGSMDGPLVSAPTGLELPESGEYVAEVVFYCSASTTQIQLITPTLRVVNGAFAGDCLDPGAVRGPLNQPLSVGHLSAGDKAIFEFIVHTTSGGGYSLRSNARGICNIYDLSKDGSVEFLYKCQDGTNSHKDWETEMGLDEMDDIWFKVRRVAD